jgi:hypothetical protein
MKNIINLENPSNNKYITYENPSNNILLFGNKPKRVLKKPLKKPLKKSLRTTPTNVNKSTNTDKKIYHDKGCQTIFTTNTEIGVSTKDLEKYIETYKINLMLNIDKTKKDEYKRKIAEIHGKTLNVVVNDE